MQGEERYGKLARAGSYLPPLGLAYLAGMLENAGHHIRILDGSIGEVTPETIVSEISKNRATRLVGFSVYTPSYYQAVQCAKLVKRINP